MPKVRLPFAAMISSRVSILISINLLFSGNTLTSTAYYLATHPDVQDRLIREIDELVETRGDKPLYEVVQKAVYLDQVICEVLRLSGPAFLLIRQCAEVATCKGIRFPKGIDVYIPAYVLHRDPEVWDNPLEFNPDNFSSRGEEQARPLLISSPLEQVHANVLVCDLPCWRSNKDCWKSCSDSSLNALQKPCLLLSIGLCY